MSSNGVKSEVENAFERHIAVSVDILRFRLPYKLAIFGMRHAADDQNFSPNIHQEIKDFCKLRLPLIAPLPNQASFA